MINRYIVFSIIFVLLSVLTVWAAITIGNVTTATGDATTVSVTHNNDGDLVFICGAAKTSGSANITDQTYNSVSMTQIGSELSQGDLQDTRMSYINPGASGNNTASQVHDAAEAAEFIVISLNGVDQTSPVDANTSSQGNSADPTDSITTVNDNALVVACVHWEDAADSITASGWTLQGTASEGSEQTKMFTKTTTTAGNVTFDVSSGGAADDWIIRLVSFKEAAGAPATVRRVIMQ